MPVSIAGDGTLTGVDPALSGFGKTLQVVQTVKTDTFTTTSTSYTTVTGLSVTITPTSATSKVLLVAQITYGRADNLATGTFRFGGGNADSYEGDSASSRLLGVFGGFSGTDDDSFTYSGNMVYLDSPATTSATTYTVDARCGNTGTVYVNRSGADVDGANTVRGASSFTAIEVAA